MESIYHQYFEDPRYRPQVLTRRMLEGRLLGRKSGTGFYSYVDGKGTVPADPEPPSQLPPRVWIDPTLAALAGRARSALGPGVEVDDAAEPGAHSLIVVTPLGRDATHVIAAQGLDARRTVGFDGLFPGRSVRCLFANPGWDPAWTERARAAFHASGTHVHLVRDSVGLIAQRVLSHVVNVACSIAERRIAAPAEVDRAVVLGLAYPEGPLAWGDILGASQVHAMLAAMLAATGDPRYRPATWLTRRAALGLSLLQAD